MSELYSVQVKSGNSSKEIAVYCGDITTFAEPIDILTSSAYVRSYAPTPRTLFEALYEHNISVSLLATNPEIDLRNLCNIWLSKHIKSTDLAIGRIGCIELIGSHLDWLEDYQVEHTMINSIRAYFSMLDIAALTGIKMDTIALPLLGSGSQDVSPSFLLVPLVNECISFLKRNSSVKRIYFIERSFEKANLIAECLRKSYRFSEPSFPEPTPSPKKPLAFISYSTPDKNIADNLCSKLENKGVKVWYAPRDVKGPYAQSITQAIDESTHFIVVLSQNSLMSEHVLNEIDLAFQRLPDKIKFKPLKIDDAMFTPSFKYYLSRQHWMDASVPPLEERLNEFVDKLLSDSE